MSKKELFSYPELITIPQQEYERLRRIEAVAKKLDQDAAPKNWEQRDNWGDYQGSEPWMNSEGVTRQVDDVDISNSGDVHSHGYAVGFRAAANRFRHLLEEREDGDES